MADWTRIRYDDNESIIEFKVVDDEVDVFVLPKMLEGLTFYLPITAAKEFAMALLLELEKAERDG